jgi:hypothetical protein
MKLSFLPDGHFSHGQVSSYMVDLPSGETAHLIRVPDGWELSVRTLNGQTVRRGLFASSYDAVMVLEAEFFPTEGATFPNKQ